jgi:hypothetical protein
LDYGTTRCGPEGLLPAEGFDGLQDISSYDQCGRFVISPHEKIQKPFRTLQVNKPFRPFAPLECGTVRSKGLKAVMLSGNDSEAAVPVN